MAATGQISKLQLYNAKEIDASLLEQNRLVNAFATKPEYLGMVMSRRLQTASGGFSGNYKGGLSTMTEGLGNTIFITAQQYEWDLAISQGFYGTVNKPASSVEQNTTNPGINRSTFRIALDKKYFAQSDVLVNENQRQMRVQEEPYSDGNSFIYTCQLIDPRADAFIPIAEIDLGQRYQRMFSAVEEGSSAGGSFQMNTPIKLQNNLTTLRLNYAVTRSAAMTKQFIELPSAGGEKTTKIWATQAEWYGAGRFLTDQDLSMIYGQYNRDATGRIYLNGGSGRPVFMGAGLRDQIPDINKFGYSGSLSFDYLDKILMQLSDSTNASGNTENFVAYTGKMGLRVLSEAIRKKYASSTSLVTITQGSGIFLSGKGNELKFEGDQFTSVNFPHGVKLTLVHLPMLDSKENFGMKLHPVSGMPYESYRIWLINHGQNDKGKPLVNKVYRKGSENIMFNVSGSIDPAMVTGSSIQTSRGSSKDGYQVYFLSECGIRLGDPLSCAELYLY